MADTVKGTITITKYIPITGAHTMDTEAYEDTLFSAISDLVSKLGYHLEMRTDVDPYKGEAWIQVTAKKKDDPK